MQIIKTINEMRAITKRLGADGKSIGLVPTMGALHAGHKSLIDRSVSENDATIVSVFVNPIQFGPNEDFEKYPRTLDADAEIASDSRADYIFAPSAAEMYPQKNLAYVDITDLQDNLCGAKRPGHFRGVCTVVSKLFNICSPNKAYFGKKDIQQLYIIKQMTSDLNFSTEVVPCEIMRDKDGLALSSRNVYLSPDERKSALVLSLSIKKAYSAISDGETSSQIVINMIKGMIAGVENAKIDYVSIVTPQFKDTDTIDDGNILALAVYIGKTRLIDNYIIGETLCF